jgi:predicted nucleotidyltransferase
MSPLFGIKTEEWMIFWDIVKKYNIPGSWWVFGSRAKDRHKPYSDLDICLKAVAPIPRGIRAQIEEDLRESNFPYIVDFCVYDEMNSDFQKIVDRDGVEVGH